MPLCVAFSGFTNSPWLALQWKYRFPCTIPSFLPAANNNNAIVEPLIKDPPRKRQPLNKGHTSGLLSRRSFLSSEKRTTSHSKRANSGSQSVLYSEVIERQTPNKDMAILSTHHHTHTWFSKLHPQPHSLSKVRDPNESDDTQLLVGKDAHSLSEHHVR